MATAKSLCGLYQGRKKVLEGRRDELSPTERKELERSKSAIELRLWPDRSFDYEITHGVWRLSGERITCTPTMFGGQSIEEMKLRAEQMGRSFTLAFLFWPFDLLIDGDLLLRRNEESPIYIEFSLAGS